MKSLVKSVFGVIVVVVVLVLVLVVVLVAMATVVMSNHTPYYLI